MRLCRLRVCVCEPVLGGALEEGGGGEDQHAGLRGGPPPPGPRHGRLGRRLPRHRPPLDRVGALPLRRRMLAVHLGRRDGAPEVVGQAQPACSGLDSPEKVLPLVAYEQRPLELVPDGESTLATAAAAGSAGGHAMRVVCVE
jgi:hypothetical protein